MPEEDLKHPQEQPVPSSKPNEEDYYTPKISESGEIKTLVSWEAPSRPYRPKDRSYYTTVGIIVIFLVLIAFMAQEYMLIGAIISFMFVVYVLAFVPPHDVKYKISTQGITIGERFYFWHELVAFWFKEKEGHKVLYVQTRIRFPGQLIIVLGKQQEEEVKKVIAHFLPFHEMPRTPMFEKLAESLQKNFHLESNHKS